MLIKINVIGDCCLLV